MSATLHPRQELFCRYVAEGASLAAAARMAGYSPNSARERGSELHSRPEIVDRIDELRLAGQDARLREGRMLLAWFQDFADKALAKERFGDAVRAMIAAARVFREMYLPRRSPEEAPFRPHLDGRPLAAARVAASGSVAMPHPEPAAEPHPEPLRPEPRADPPLNRQQRRAMERLLRKAG